MKNLFDLFNKEKVDEVKQDLSNMVSKEKIEEVKNDISNAIKKVECACKNSIKFKLKMLDGCEQYVPSKAHPEDAGFDLYACESTLVPAGTVVAVSVGFKCALPKGYELQIRPRSGLVLKNYITVANTPGTVDCNYRGIVKVLVYNFGQNDYQVTPGIRIAQGVITKLPDVKIELVDELDETSRGDGGFGSSGINLIKN